MNNTLRLVRAVLPPACELSVSVVFVVKSSRSGDEHDLRWTALQTSESAECILKKWIYSPSPSAQIFTWPPFKIWSCVCSMLLWFSWMHYTRSKFLTFTDTEKISIWCIALTLKTVYTKSAQKVNRNVSPFFKGFSMDFLNHRGIKFPHIKISHYWISLFTLCIQTDTKMWKWGHQKLTCVHR